MDQALIKLLEDDEDESMHSGADVDAFTAELNRDIGRDGPFISRLSDSSAGVLSHGGSFTTSHLLGVWQTSNQEKNLAQQIQPREEKQQLQLTDQLLLQVEPPQVSAPENQHQRIDKQPEHDQLLSLQENAKSDWAQHSESQKCMEQQLNRQQVLTTSLANNLMKPIGSEVYFEWLMSTLLPLLDKDRSMQLRAFYTKLTTLEITEEDFIRVTKCIVGDRMFREAAHQAQTQVTACQTNKSHHLSQIEASSQQLSSHGTQQFAEPQTASQPHLFSLLQNQKGQKAPPHQSQIPASAIKVQVEANISTLKNNSQNLCEAESNLGVKGRLAAQTSSTTANDNNPEGEFFKLSSQPLSNLQQQRHLPETSLPMCGTSISNFHTHAYPRPSLHTAASLELQTQNSQMRQAAYTQGMASAHLGAPQPLNIVNMHKYESMDNIQRLHGCSLPPLANQHQRPVAWQHLSVNMQTQQSGSAIPSMTSVKQEVADECSGYQFNPQPIVSQVPSFGSVQTGQGSTAMCGRHEMNSSKMGFCVSTNMTSTKRISGSKTTKLKPAVQDQLHCPRSTSIFGTSMPLKKPSVGLKKPLEELGCSPPPAGKRQKVSGGFLDQSIDQLSDVTAISGVILRDEEEQLFAAPEEGIRASEAIQRVVHEEEERLILQKGPLMRKLAEIISKSGIEKISDDVEHCLSMFVEDRLHGVITNLIRLSKQRIDIEKRRHQFVVTSDVQRHILMINQKAKKEWEKKLAEEAEKLQKLNEIDGNSGADADKDKDDSRLKARKANKEEEDKMRTTAANVAARTAVGGTDLFPKWQLMYEKAQQRREELPGYGTSGENGNSSRSLLNHGRASREPRAGNRGPAAASSGVKRKFGRMGIDVKRSISIKDVIAVLEREPQMSRSTLVYSLHERVAETPARTM